MPAASLSPAVIPKTYAQLRDAVISVVIKGRREIDRAWLGTYYETGRLINEHVLLFRDRADYGAKTFVRLAADTGINIRTLRQCAQFHRCFPIRHTCAELDWSKCRLLCEVTDPKEREKLLAQAKKNQWTVLELDARVRAVNAVAIESAGNNAAEPVELLTPRRGTPGLHLIADRGAGPVVDLGFMLYRDLKEGAARLRPYKVGDIVRLNEDGVRKVDGATKDQLFTYAATVRRVIDGDTLVATVMVAPGYSRELKLRLRGLDCPEMSTAAGRAAKRFVDGLIAAGDEVIVSTSKPDKYDRYLADVFIRQLRVESSELSDRGSAKASQPSALNSQPAAELFLNNALLENGHAVRYDGGAKEEM